LVVKNAAAGAWFGGYELIKGEPADWSVFSAPQCFYLGFE